jgi:hypothetical protein
MPSNGYYCKAQMNNRKIYWILGIVLVACLFYLLHGREADPRIKVIASLRPPMAGVPRGARRGGGARNGANRGGPGRSGGADGGTNFLVLFEMLNPSQLTSVKVTEVVTNESHPLEHILWHLVSTNGSNPIKTFFYGQNIDGMGSYLPGVNVEPLLPHVAYRLDLQAGKIKGSAVFQTVELAQ